MNTKLAFGVFCFLIANGPAQSEVLKVGGTGAALGLLQKLSGAFSDVHPGDKVQVVDGLGEFYTQSSTEIGGPGIGGHPQLAPIARAPARIVWLISVVGSAI